MSATRIALCSAAGLAVLMTAAVFSLRAWQPGMGEYRGHAAPAASPDGPQARWFGVTALLVRDGEHAIFIDPFFTRPKGLLNMALNRDIAPDEVLIRRWLESAGVKRLDAVLVSHSHFDHAMDAAVVARLTGAVLLGSASTANIGRGGGLPEAQILIAPPGKPQSFGPFTLTFIESRHAGATGGAPTGDISQPLRPPAHYLDYKLGGAYSILVQHARGSLLHHGSAGFVPGALRDYRADTVFLGVALVDDLESYLGEVVTAVGARRVIPTHWDDFTRPLDEPLRPMPLIVRLDKFFAAMRKHPELQVQTLEVGQPLTLWDGA